MSKRCLGCMELFGNEFEICPHCGYIVGTHAEEAIHIEPGTLLYDRYIVGKVLGYGGFGVTYLGWDGKLEQKVAIKEYLPGEFSTRMPGQSQVTIFNGDKHEQFNDGLKKFIEEAKRLAKFQNEPGIVKIFDSFEENDTAYIVMEYLEGETLTEYLRRERRISEDDAVAMLMPVMESLQAVHAEGILHRDIAPDNIFLTKTGEVKLIDFGASRYATTSHSRSLTVIIKPGYSPEEQYRSKGDQGPYTDVYALASTLYKMITGKTPPDAMERRAKYENQNKDILEEPHQLEKNISRNREVAILNAMNVRIEDRTPDIPTFIRELNADPPAKRIYGKIKKLDLYAWPLWLKILVPSVLALMLVFGGLLLFDVIDFSNYSEEIVIPDGIVTVPDVEGLYTNEALDLVEASHLLASTGGTVESEYIPAGKIVLQTPIGGSYMDKNGTILLVVSSGAGVQGAVDGISTVPYVVWDSQDNALSKLAQANLGAPIIEEAFDDSVTVGHVISQSVEAGTKVDEGTVITLVISKGAAPFEMIDVTGKDIEDAEAELLAKGLVVTIEYANDDSVPENSVISQSVNKGEEVKRGDKITLVVSSGKKTIKVPDVVGKKKDDATKALEDQGFKVLVLENFDNEVEAGKVISQSPEAGSSQLKGDTITIYVSKGKRDIAVTFDANSGQASTTSKSVKYAEAYGELPTATRAGYVFLGWFTGKNDGEQVTDTSKVSQESAHTLYAHWKLEGCAVSFNANGGSVSTDSKKVEYQSKYGDLPTPTRNGYTFDGWYTSATGGSKVTADSTVNETSAHTLYAHWTAKSYSISFDANGGSVSTSSKSVAYGSTYGDLPTPTRTGYNFDGWYTAASGGAKITRDMKVSVASNQTLYARWSALKDGVTFNANGGSVSTTNKSVTYASNYGDLPTPTRTGYTFDGWYTAASGGSLITSTSKVTTVGAHTLYAHWNANSYAVTFNANGGSGSMNKQVFTYDKAQALTSNAFTNGSAVFLGWSTSSSDKTAKYTNGQSVSNLTSSANGSVTLYAVWESVTISNTSVSLTQEPTGVTLSTYAMTLATIKTDSYNQSSTITASVSGYSSPTKALSATVSSGASGITWSSSKSSVATVDSNGVVTAVSAGTATITAKTATGATATCTVTVSVGSSTISWSSSTASVAGVSYGTVSARGRGSTTITASTANGKTASCSVTVFEAYKAIPLTQANAYANFHISSMSNRGLFFYCNTSGKTTSFSFTFVTGNSAPTSGCLYQCYASSSGNGCRIYFNSGKVVASQAYNNSWSTITSSYKLAARTKYTVTVSIANVGYDCTITIKNESGTTLNTTTGKFTSRSSDGASNATIGPKSSIKDGNVPNINLISVSFSGTQGYYGYGTIKSFSFDCTNAAIGTTSFKSGSFTADFTATKVQYCYR